MNEWKDISYEHKQLFVYKFERQLNTNYKLIIYRLPDDFWHWVIKNELNKFIHIDGRIETNEIFSIKQAQEKAEFEYKEFISLIHKELINNEIT